MPAPSSSFTKVWHSDTYPAINPTKPELSVAGKSVVITGGGAGIGGGIASSYARAGASRIALIGRREQLLRDKQAELLEISPSSIIIYVAADISSKEEIDVALKKIGDSFGALDILVHNAAYFSGIVAAQEGNTVEFFKSFEANVKGTLVTTTAFLKYAVEDATIVNISTAIAHLDPVIFPGFSAYASSKMAAAVFMNYVQVENKKLHVVHVHPGQILTDMTAKLGKTNLTDLPELPSDFSVWVASPEAKFLKGKFVWANWDVEEMKSRAKEIEGGDALTFVLKF